MGAAAVALLGLALVLAFWPDADSPSAEGSAAGTGAVDPEAVVVAAPVAIERPDAAPPPATSSAAAPAPAPVAPEVAVAVAAEVPLAPEIAQELNEAEDAMEEGDLGAAAAKAQHAVMVQASSRGQALLVRIACRQRDVEKALAALEGVGPRDRARVIRECKERGVGLE
ncbi:MAG: hypothetical protein QM765_34860 [Myxococcales bacterium]